MFSSVFSRRELRDVVCRSPQGFIIAVSLNRLYLEYTYHSLYLLVKGIKRGTAMLFRTSKRLRVKRSDLRAPAETLFAASCLCRISLLQAVEQAYSLPSPHNRLAAFASGKGRFISPLTVESQKGYQYDRAESDGNHATSPIVAARFRMFYHFFLRWPERTSETIGVYVSAC